MYMMPISRPKNVLLSARWKYLCGPPRYGGGRSNNLAPSGPSRCCSMQARWTPACSGVSRSLMIAWIIGSRL